MIRAARSVAAFWLVCACSAAGSAPTTDTQPDFPDSYRDSFVEVRSCRPSGDHNLNNVRVLATPRAEPAYRSHAAPFSQGDVLLKEEFEFGDSNCSGAPTRWTSMLRLGQKHAGVDGWRWERVDPGRDVVEIDSAACMGCHAACGVAPDGFESTCGQQ